MGNRSLGKFIALVLRHHPERIGITLDGNGWADVDALIEGVNGNSRYKIDRNRLEEIVRTDEKGRYSFDKTGRKIRANQGHSIPVDVELKEALPPAVLWHGTAEKSMVSIEQKGLLPMGRLYVHLSRDADTAEKVGRRHGKPIVYRIDCKRMSEDGYRFWLSANNVWLTSEVPPQYLERIG